METWEAIQQAEEDGYASRVKMLEMKEPTEFETTVGQVSSAGYDVVVSTFFLIGPNWNLVEGTFLYGELHRKSKPVERNALASA